jgi:hypothetical protein
MAKIPISGTYTVAGGKITFTPDDPLPNEVVIEVTLNSAIRGLQNERLANDYAFSFTTEELTKFFMFMTWDSLQPAEDVDYLDDGLTITPTGVSAVESDHRIVGTGCLELGAGDYTEITGSSTILDAAIKNIGTYFFPTDTNDETFKVLEMFDDEDTSLLAVVYDASDGSLTVGGEAATGTFAANQYYWLELVEDTGNYILKINGVEVTLADTVAVPTGCVKIVLGVSTAETPTDRIYFDNTMMAK